MYLALEPTGWPDPGDRRGLWISENHLMKVVHQLGGPASSSDPGKGGGVRLRVSQRTFDWASRAASEGEARSSSARAGVERLPDRTVCGWRRSWPRLRCAVHTLDGYTLATSWSTQEAAPRAGGIRVLTGGAMKTLNRGIATLAVSALRWPGAPSQRRINTLRHGHDPVAKLEPDHGRPWATTPPAQGMEALRAAFAGRLARSMPAHWRRRTCALGATIESRSRRSSPSASSSRSGRRAARDRRRAARRRGRPAGQGAGHPGGCAHRRSPP